MVVAPGAGTLGSGQGIPNLPCRILWLGHIDIEQWGMGVHPEPHHHLLLRGAHHPGIRPPASTFLSR